MTDRGEGVVPASAIAGIALASVLVPLNSTMIAVALPHIAREFSISKAGASVLVTIYLAAMLVAQPVAGRVSDALGASRVAVVATTGFGLVSAVATVAPTFWLLVSLRAVQALFAAALVPSVQTMLRDSVPGRERGRAFGVQGSVLGVGAGLGPLIGGIATATAGWRSIFGVNIPIVLVVLHVLRRRVPAPGAGVAAESRGSRAEPVEAGRLFNAVFATAFFTQALAVFAQYALLLAIPIVLDSRGWSAASIGVAVSFLTFGMVVTGPFGGRAGDLHGRRWPAVGGLAVAVFAVAMSAVGGDQVSSGVLVVTLLLFGLGLGIASPSIMTAGIESAPVGRSGSSAGLLSASRYVGSIASTLVLAGVVHDDGSGLAVLLAVCVVMLASSVALAPGLPGRLAEAPELVP